ncbi:MAG: HlyC/CorC family transporter [Deltaproteobacteria bacterium]|nr:HlyC/CorC family transporter [Deltaproteobacteria bacterium]
MDLSAIVKLALVAFLMGIAGLFSCSEAALFSLTPLHMHRMAEERFPFLSHVRRLLAYPRRLLVTVIVGNEAVNTTISVLMASLCISLLGDKGEWVSIAVTTPMLLVFSEALPKTFGVTYPMRLAAFLSPVLVFFSWIEKPVVWLLESVSGWFAAMFIRDKATPERVLTEEEFRSLIDLGQREGALEGVQRDLIHRVFDLDDKTVSEVMVPRVDMFCLPLSLGLEEMEREIVATRHTRIPVYGADRDDIVGILFARDLIEKMKSPETPLQLDRLLRKPYFVPEAKRVGGLLRDFQIRKLRIAIVVDEYGGVSGLVTLEDILEDLFEDLYDASGLRRDLWERIDESTIVVSGRMSMEGFRELADIPDPVEDFDTVGGFVFHLFGKLPAAGEVVRFGQHTFRVETMGKARILKIVVRRDEETTDD